MEIYNKVKTQECKVCSSKTSPSWTMYFERCTEFQSKLNSAGTDIDIFPTDWVCDACKIKHEEKSDENVNCDDEKVLIGKSVTESIERITRDGCVRRRMIIDDFKEKIAPLDLQRPKSEIIELFKNNLSSNISKCNNIQSYSQEKDIRRIGSVYYDKSKVSLALVEEFYSLLSEKDNYHRELEEWKKCGIKESEISQMLEQQVELFTQMDGPVDYRTLLEDTSKSDNGSQVLI